MTMNGSEKAEKGLFPVEEPAGIIGPCTFQELKASPQDCRQGVRRRQSEASKGAGQAPDHAGAIGQTKNYDQTS